MMRRVLLLAAAGAAVAVCPDQPDAASCQRAGCLWSTLWAPNMCTDDPCKAKPNEDACIDEAKVAPYPCSAPWGDPEFCLVPVCHYDPSAVVPCQVAQCLYQDAATCQAGGCTWEPPVVSTGEPEAAADLVGHCKGDYCKGTPQAACATRVGCKWQGADCVASVCGKHQDEKGCAHDGRCHWDVATGVCGETACGAVTVQGSCQTTATCMWDSTSKACVPKTCDKHNHPLDRCKCLEDAACKWHESGSNSFCADPRFNTCPDLDIAFVLDGSGSMRRSFGRHPHGFYGLMEILREWMKTVPLTGDDHTVGAAAKTGTGAFRMTFIQFSRAEARPDQDHPMGCAVGVCTDGLLSGRRDELNGDIDWHEANYQAHWTYLHDALKDVADHTFLPTQSPPGRQHVVIIIADGGITDIDSDACCQTRCGDRRCMDYNWVPRYRTMLDAAQAKLRSEGVTVFGIVMRRFDYHTFQDENAQAKLTPLVTIPTDTHFMNLMLDEIPSRVLNTLCDPNSKFGKVLTKKTTGAACGTKSKDTCQTTTACQWDSAQAKCADSSCYPLCTQAKCDANTLCKWSGSRCDLKPPGCLAKDETKCKADKTCLWNPLWTNKCIENPCLPQTKRDTCVATSVTMPAPCDTSTTNADFCDMEVCTFDETKPSCEVKKCLQVSKDTCEKEPGCVWSGKLASPPATVSPGDKVKMCNPKPCTHAQQADCTKDPLCKWDATKKCIVTDECKRHADELKCDKDPKCHWDAKGTPTVCSETVCAKHSAQTPCDTDAKCMWTKVKNVDVCVPKTCAKHTAKCPCTTDKDCVWHHGPQGAFCTTPQFNTCPDLDIAFVLDGSGSMRRSFGRHPHGFYGLMEILREWMKTVPLTGDDHTAGAAKASRGKGFRMTFIQFSRAEATPDQDHPMGCAVGACTNGLLSGRRDELNGDIDWHEDNYQSQWTYLHDALKDVADHTFIPTQSPAWRQHVVIIIADGGITDIDGDACCETRCGDRRCMDRRWKPTYPTILNAAQAKLRSEGVTVFGIVMRRFDYHTFQDDNAQAKLTPLVSEPSYEHFMNLMLDEIPSKVLNTLCDPNSKFGKVIVGKQKIGCAVQKEAAACASDAACVWDKLAAPAVCKESVCYPLCTETDCKKNPSCDWKGTECVYKPPGCLSKDETKCKADKTCLWNPLWADKCIDNPCLPPTKESNCYAVGVTMPAPCDSPAADPDFCKLDVCQFDAKKQPSCEVKKCLQVSKDTCEKEPGCVWSGNVASPNATVSPGDKVKMCNPKPCTHAQQADCTKDPLCKWDATKKCIVTDECKRHADELKCDKDPKCHWDVKGTPTVCSETVCAKHSAQTPCDTDAKCMWTKVKNVDVCVPKTCAKHTTRCPCTTDKDCVWHHAPQGAFCTIPQFNTCPDLDIAFVLDGSGSMRRSFGRHPHGFYGLMEIMREWMKTVPLTGDDHTVGAAAKTGTGAFRMTFIQFSMAEATPDQDHPTGCAVGACTNGMLSGRQDELNGDIDWHEENYQSQWTYLHDALRDVADHTFLPTQSPPGRQHVVIIIADGGITDLDGDACCEDTCGDPRCMDRRWKPTYPGMLNDAQAKLRSEGVTVFGIVMRRFDYHTFQDDNAQKKLTPLVSNPRGDHFMNLMLDEIPSKVLNTFCDPNSKFGKKVAVAPLTCKDLKNSTHCISDTACVWDATAAACSESVCYPLCTKADCDTNTLCFWGGKECKLTPVTPAPATPTPPTPVPPTPLPATPAPATPSPPTPAPPTPAPPTVAPPTSAPPTDAPTPVPTPEPPVDECVDTATKKICTAKGQTCTDPDHKKKGDWKCLCPPPSKLTAVGKPVADCSFDECKQKNVVCVQLGQKCKDTDLLKKDTWQCECLPPQTGASVPLGPAVCKDPPGDCEVHGATCHAAGQTCVAGTDDKDRKFECACVAPSKGTNGKNAVAVCVLDECKDVCPTCAKTKAAGANVCEAAGQDCEDLNTGHANLRDWRCKCKPPMVGAKTTAPADCTMDECKVKCPTCADTGSGNVCSKAGQTCVEHDVRNTSDWECVCIAPKVGLGKAAVAVCTEDECRSQETVCVAAGQSCHDADPTKAGSWECRCPPPSKTVAIGAVAVCEEDECKVDANKEKCTAAGQTCVDPDLKTKDSWECHCPPPSTGKQQLGAAVPCRLDECKAVCPTCASTDKAAANVCEAKNQTCHDPITTAASVSDWTCTCKGSAKSAVTAPVAQCKEGKDECVEYSSAVTCAHVPRYTKDGCLCACGWTATFKDHTGKPIQLPPGPGASKPCDTGCCNPQADPSGDWCYLAADDYNKKTPQCSARRQSCVAAGQVPADGGKPSAQKPVPGIPSGQSNKCTEKGQLCVDPNKLVTDDWQCKCVPPKTGAPGIQVPAVCVEDECTEHAAVCLTMNQRCVDPNTASNNDWYCECTVGPATKKVGGVAVCVLDECIEVCPTCATENSTDVCAAVGQVCADPKQTDTSLGDWVCKCAPPAVGSNVGGPVARCILDECVLACPTCAYDATAKKTVCEKKGQTCEDPNKDAASTSDWRCKCPPPSHTLAVGNAALCEEDECEANGKVCLQGQQCVDPDQLKKDDWYCECVAPAKGSQVKGPAVCEQDECKTKGSVCAKAGQTCKDHDVKKLGNWFCECIAPDRGVAGVQKPAKCLPPDVCKEGGEAVCSAAGQHCEKAPGGTKFQCACIAPYTGAAVVGKAAVCTLDECATVCPSCQKTSVKQKKGVCDLHDQVCEDPDKTKTGDWVCKCKLPSRGNALVGSAAVCVLDECKETCTTCEKDVCSAKGQTCVDPSTSPLHVSDWMCKCKPPSTNSRTGAPVQECLFDECTQGSAACTAAGQVCVDADMKGTDNWECHCPPPSSGSAVKGPAATCSLNECAAQCPTCADTGKGNVCVLDQQVCVDPDHHTPSDWFCQCTEGSSYQVGGVVPKCILDECKEVCTTCADKGGGNVCTRDGQTCVDKNTEAYAKGDWQCRCPPPLQDKYATAGLAVCGLDECTEAVNGTVAGLICAAAGQTCHDSHLGTLGDFDCVCTTPRQGAKTGAPATCTTDECLVHGDVCMKANQTCLDKNTTSLNDWECVCPLPSSTIQQGGAATCEVDECIDNRYVCEGAKPVQQCVDTDRQKMGTWVCRCASPSSGSSVGKVASCLLNECTDQCATCENGVCKAAGQTCEDPNTAYSSLHDWVCKCAPPSKQSAVVHAAVCSVDECERARHVCAAAGQMCVDPNKAANSLSDWECHCQAPASGKAKKGLAVCIVDECKSHGHVCITHGQVCADTHKGEKSLNDWECLCPAPEVGTPGKQKAASCRMVGECEDPTVSDVCTSAGQVCDDPDKAKKGDWRCLCLPPATGAPGAMAAATCALDECVSQCSTCAGSACTDAGQTCVDVNKDPLTGLNSWECRCVAPASGSQVGAAAVCQENECDVHRSTCTTAGQDCVDPNPKVLGDWRCECKVPGKGQSTGSVAQCVVDECDTHGVVCTAKGQTCIDKNTAASSLNDWECQCAAPWAGSAVIAPAKCTLDECTLYGDVCRGAGQKCVDLEVGLEGFWRCFCPPPNERVSRAGSPARCMVDECKDVFGNVTAVLVKKGVNLCEKAGQTCVDPDTSYNHLGNWMCQCPESNQTAVGNPAVCEVDECTIQNTTACGAGQLCVDPKWTTKDDWECRCAPPAVGHALMGPAVCMEDECAQHEKDCHAFGQVCVDADQSNNGTWECHCPPGGPITGQALMGAAECTPPKSECAMEAVRRTCSAKGQACADPNLRKSNDWRCECLAPAAGLPAVGAPATCILDECVGNCTTCENGVCSEAKQACVDPNTDGASLGDWVCRCTQGVQGSATAQAATYQLDECATVCHTCADHGKGNVCTLTGTLCHDPNHDARSVSDWMCVCKPPAVGSRTLGIPVCIVDECVTLQGAPSACAAGQTCTDPNTDPSSLGDYVCTCPLPQTGTGVGHAAHCVLNECNKPGNFRVCEKDGQVCIDPRPVPGSTGDWECHCPQGNVFGVTKAATCVLDECKETCKTCANKGGGNVCMQAGQTCYDPNTAVTSTHDWMCNCTTGGGTAVANVAVCQTDECVDVTNYGAVTCKDSPRVTVDGCACECGWKYTELSFLGVGPGIDSECFAGCCNPTGRTGGDWCIVANTAANKAKGCPVSGKLADRMRTCALPAKGSPTSTACGAGQLCVDPNTAAQSLGDWQCQCQAPSFGEPGVKKPATCVTDECKDKGQVCVGAGQECRDGPGVGDWKCVCPTGAEGEAAGAVASCTWHGECVKNAAVCTQVGQMCFDPDVKKAGDWVCRCVEPASGVSARGAPANCKLNECTAKCPTCADKGSGNVCEAAGQRCEEKSSAPSDLSDWHCQCPAGQVGMKALAPAECHLDECLANNGRLAQVCGAAGQTCVDPNTRVATGTGDWKCVCPAPTTGEATAHPASCVWDECKDDKNRKVCVDAGQLCEDPSQDAASKNDWQCKCQRTFENKPVTKVGAPAVCKSSSWCKRYGMTCTQRGQLCVTAPKTTREGRCMCVEPQTEMGTPLTFVSTAAVAAHCILDECAAVCPTCANTGTGNVCEKAGQTCVEGSTEPTKTHDWRCICKGKTGSAVAAVATCANNECEGPGLVCRKHEQKCTDPDTAIDNDWYCTCHPPADGRQNLGAAKCTLDECVLHGQVCTAAGQTCFDPDMTETKLGDWECRCPSPATGKSTAKAATCTYVGDCADKATASVCEKAGQTCYDPDVATTGDWECHCVSPQVGAYTKNAPAKCILDECHAACESCATKPGSQKHVCMAAEQQCIDPNKDPSSTGDWRCHCVAPAFGEQRGAAAACLVDECAVPANQRACASMNTKNNVVQMCVDPEKTKRGDWVCQCVWPYVGAPGKRELATCRVDECTVEKKWLPQGKVNGNEVCAKAGQRCVDPKQDVDALGDWVCQCPDPNDGSAIASVAQCKTVSNCTKFGSQCGEGQMCVEKSGDWYCECLAPLVGEKLNGRAPCILDECKSQCETCAQQGLSHTCVSAGQSCIDRNTATDSLRDWSCECKVGKGSALGGVAVCEVDECVANRVVCEAMGQICEDPYKDVDHSGDWMCTCLSPASGFAVAGVASCTLDECGTYGHVCAAAGQHCVDQSTSPASRGDWTCNCPKPAKESMVAGVATCTYTGGCHIEANLKVCAAAGQKCVPGANATDINSWRCACLAPFHGTPGEKAVATCSVNECDDICPTCARTSRESVNVCTAAGQRCVDPDMSMNKLGDWTCQCIEPATATAVGKPVSKCTVDECAMSTATGALTCAHFRRYTLDGCECACDWVASSDTGIVGTGPGASKPCHTACCNPNRAADGDWCYVADTPFNRKNPKCAAKQRKTCSVSTTPAPAGAPQPQFQNICEEKGQTCMDVDHSPTVLGSWECRCPHSDGKQQLAPAACEVDECITVTMCLKAGQTCNDTNKASGSLNDWECVCPPHAKGSKKGGVADCTHDDGDECKTHDATCKAVGQYCYDTALHHPGDWECRCPSPATTEKPGAQGPATCQLDECTLQCPTCADKGDGAGFACKGAGQRCVDPGTGVTQLADWRCECVEPAKGSVGAAQRAVCVYDECLLPANANVCSAANQDCMDSDKSEASLNDWTCICRSPQMGKALVSAASCRRDECLDRANARVCSVAGQACYDPDTRDSVKDDWKCRCPRPSVGDGVATPATCRFTGECADPAIASVCTSQGQTCVDPDVVHSGDWVCQCVYPQTGVNGLGKPAKCGIDECLAECATCESDACTAKKQVCVDPDVTVEGDWMCQCQAPQTGTPAVGKPAACSGVLCNDLSSKACTTEPQCSYDPVQGLCLVVGWNASRTETLTLTLTLNDTEWRGIGNGDDDDTCVLCWLLPLLLLLCCSCCILAFLALRKRQQNNEADDEKWNKQFEAEIGSDDDENLGMRSPARSGDADEALLTEEMAENRKDDEDI